MIGGKRNMVGSRLGLSVYLDFMDLETIKHQLLVAKQLGYTDVFTSMQLHNLGFKDTVDIQEDQQKELFQLCNELELVCHVDVNREVFFQLGASIEDLSIFLDWQIPVIRLDGGFYDEEVVTLTNNPFGILIEDNLSNARALTNRLELIKHKGNLKHYLGCHNFFPHNETGLSLAFAIEMAQLFKAYGCQTGIFISSLSSPHDLFEYGFGVPTIEEHRYLPSYIQAMELVMTQVFDYIMFGDSYPSEEELKQVAQYALNPLIMKKDEYSNQDQLMLCLSIPIYLESYLTTNQVETLLNTIHQNRQDCSVDVVRSTVTRQVIWMKPSHLLSRPLGTITVEHDKAGRYAGEINISTRDLKASYSANVIGYVKPYARHLLAYTEQTNVVFKLVLE